MHCVDSKRQCAITSLNGKWLYLYLKRSGFLFPQLNELFGEDCAGLFVSGFCRFLDFHFDFLFVAFQLATITFDVTRHLPQISVVRAKSFWNKREQIRILFYFQVCLVKRFVKPNLIENNYLRIIYKGSSINDVMHFTTIYRSPNLLIHHQIFN